MPTILPPGGTIFTQHSGRPLRQGCRFFLHRSEHPCNTPDRGRHRNCLRDQERSECDKRSSLPKTPLGNIRFFPSKPGRKGTLCQPLRCRGRSRPVRSAVPAPSTPRRAAAPRTSDLIRCSSTRSPSRISCTLAHSTSSTVPAARRATLRLRRRG